MCLICTPSLTPPNERTKLDFAQPMKWLVDEQHPEAEVVRLKW